MSHRISLSPFLTLQHHSGTIPGPSITFQAFYHIPLRSFPSSSLRSLLHPLRQHSRPSLPFPASPFLFAILRFYPYPVSLRYSPFLSAILCFYLYPVSILSFSVSAWRSAGQSCSSNITINRHIVLSHFAIHLRFFSVYKPVYLGSLDFSL